MHQINKSIIIPAIAAFLFSAPAQGAENMSTHDIKEGFKRHAALTQLHSWYLLYEEPLYGIENAIDALHENVNIVSGLGEANGHAEYSDRVEELPKTWKNAHDIKSTRVEFTADGTITLTAEITYQNQGLLPENAVRTAELSYRTQLKDSDGPLPKFTSVKIGQNSDGTAENFVSQYAHNRTKALVHYWLTLIENPSRDAEPVREILADGFSLNFSSGAITSYEGFKEWLAGPGSQVKASTHLISDFAYESIGENIYQLTMNFDWNGILPDDTEMTAKTNHTWTVVDDPTKRFAQIKSMDVKVLEPFAPKTK